MGKGLKNVGKIFSKAVGAIGIGKYSAHHKAGNRARWVAARATEQIQARQNILRRQIDYLNNEYKPALVDMLKRNTEAYNLSKRNLRREYLSNFDQISEAERRNEVYTMMQVAANAQNENEDVISLLLGKNVSPLSRVIDKNQGEFETQNMSLDNKIQEVKNAYNQKMHEVEIANAEGALSIEQMESEKAHIQAEKNAFVRRTRRAGFKEAVMGLGGLGASAIGGGLLGLSTGGFGLGLGFNGAFAAGSLLGAGAFVAGSGFMNKFGSDAVGSVGGMLSGLVRSESPLSGFMKLATDPLSTLGGFDFQQGGFSALQAPLLQPVVQPRVSLHLCLRHPQLRSLRSEPLLCSP